MSEANPRHPLPECRAARVPRPVLLNASSPDPLWHTAPRYELGLGQDRVSATGALPVEGGSVQLLWDEDHLYLAADFADSEITATGRADGDMHYRFGDLVEVFLWPSDSSWYWEMYGTPAGLQTTLFIPARGSRPENITQRVPLLVSAAVTGTINNSDDIDLGFRVELAIPASELTSRGDAWGNDPSSWRILVARYNYSQWLSKTELTMYPSLSRTDFHLREEYAHLIFDSRKTRDGTLPVSGPYPARSGSGHS